ncbi:hypothetical protein [Metabacillus fastidiosus]|uniref:hypothetical protein n=1 Tax=Metabacillus fastidiosus TaxID=1458 RepID=UPI002DBC37CE|nr:hypothetical protein [Metabacillus fastidiosus]MEC2077681.1 hypothetical protein [Metabacillus fastidiosus]
MPKIMKAQDVRVQKSFRLKQETLDAIELIRKHEKQELSQGKVIDEAIKLFLQRKGLV